MSYYMTTGAQGNPVRVETGSPFNFDLTPRVVSVKPRAGTGGGGTPANLQNLIASITKAQKAQQAAARKRYKALQKQFKKVQQQVQGKMGEASSQISELGKTRAEEIKEQGTEALARTQQSAMSRGLGNTTVLDNLQQGVLKGVSKEQRALLEQLAGLRSGLATTQANQLMSLGQLGIDTSLSRIDQGPDLGAYANLIAMLTQAGG